jgi:hypothetical protein
MAAVFNIYLKDIVSKNRSFFSPNGTGAAAGKVVNLLKAYLQPVIAKKPAFSSVGVWWGPDSYTPSLFDTDVIVYVVPDVGQSIIAANGGTAARAVANTNILGLTDLNSKICEVYFDRMFQGSAKELAGAVYHEAAHIKSNIDDALHSGQDGFLTGSPDYDGNPTIKNTSFFATHLARKVSMRAGL